MSEFASEIKSKLSGLIETSLSKIKELAETDTVIGKPITTPDGTTIIPVSKLAVGIVNGGLDYSAKHLTKEGAKQYYEGSPHFGGGGGAGITMTPVAFLVISACGSVELLPIMKSPAASPSTVDRIASLIERSPEIAERIKKIFSKKKDAADADGSSASEDTDIAHEAVTE